ncbi:basic helix loop helix (bHLH) DNA-binding family protein [Medicago truncatula]|uniref:Basic helix loop helix (BHLH) DNA-binding family protein n=1 Tax=Medicago truncatula TaxID=3880 RepID=A0A072UAR9_MEDTR|nr:basic helix loop helix (bHLH) DNA-binding family protein [Medicago truncatula]
MEEINNTTMNVSSTNSWLSDLEMDEYNLFAEESNLNFLDTDVVEFLSHDIGNVFQEQNKQQCFTSGSTPKSLSNSSCYETNMELKTIDHSNKVNETFSPKLSPSNSSLQFQIPSFDNSPNSPTTKSSQLCGFDPTLNSKQNLETKTSKSKRSRTLHGQDHIMAERKRREKLTQNFIALAALVPNLKKVDKYSVLVDTIKYLKELKKRLIILEEQNEKTKIESPIILTKPGLCNNDNSSSCDESIDCVVDLPFQVEARILGKYMLIRIQCQEHIGLLVKIMVEIQRFKLFVVNNSVLPFGDSILDITIIAQLDEGYNMCIKELVKNLRMEALKFMSS